MFRCFHRQVQGIRAGQFRDPLAWVDELRADDEGRKIAVEAAHRPDRRHGTLALKSIMGDPMLDNIENLIRSAIAEINAFTKKAIEDNEIRKLVASMDAVKRNITDYSVIDDRKDQISNEFLLTDAILKTSDAISQCRTLGVDAVICNADAVSLNILSKIAFHKLTNATNSKQCVLEIIGEQEDI